MTFERTYDFALVRRILTDPGVWPYVTDDFSGAAADFAVNEHPAIWYLLAIDGGNVIGLFSFVSRNAIRWEVHVAMLRKVPPKVTRQAGREAVAWIWANTPCRRLIGEVPAYNTAAIRFGLRAMGMKAFGRDRAAIQKRGKLHDLVFMGVSRPV